jgi:hypothetical protein
MDSSSYIINKQSQAADKGLSFRFGQETDSSPQKDHAGNIIQGLRLGSVF